MAVGPMSRTPAKERAGSSFTRSTIAMSFPTPLLRLAGLRQPDGGRRASRGRDGPRPGLRGRDRRPLRPPGRLDREGLRGGHDRRDAGAGTAKPARGGVENVEFLEGDYREGSPAGRLGRRDHLQLRDQLRRQAVRVPRGRPRASARRPFRGDGHRRRRGHGQGDAARYGAVDRLHRGRPHRGEFRAELERAGFEQVEVREIHRVHHQAGSAIIRASVPA